MLRVLAFDHLVLRVEDVERALDFYCAKLGMDGVRVEEWRRGEVFFPSARASADTIIDFFARGDGEEAGRNLDHLCLVVDADVDELAASGVFPDATEPMDLFGAHGIGRAIYVHDPDGNVVELRSYR